MGPGWRRSQLPPPPACLRSQLPPGLPAPPPPPPCRRSQLPLNVCRRSQLPDARAPARWRSRLPPPPPPPARASAPAPPPHAIRQSRLQMVWRRSVVPTRRFSGAAPGGPGSRPAPPGLASTPAGTGSTPRPRRGRVAVSGRSHLGDLTWPSLGPVALGPAPGLRPHPWLQSSEARPAPNTATLPFSLAPGSTPGFGSLTVAVPTHPPYPFSMPLTFVGDGRAVSSFVPLTRTLRLVSGCPPWIPASPLPRAWPQAPALVCGVI